MNWRIMVGVWLLMAGLAVPVVAQDSDEPLRVTNIVHGTLGDLSFFDSAQRGLDEAEAVLPVVVNTIELGHEPANWQVGLDDAMGDVDNYDVMIVGTIRMMEFLAARVHEYPDKRFIMYDAVVPYADPAICVEGCTNVYSITYLQNEGSFLAGAYATAISLSDLDGTTAEPIIGAIGGVDVTTINDFLVGYEQGACLIDPDVQVLMQYAGTFEDPARGKEIALSMYDQGADIVFQIAALTGRGVFEAAEERGHYAIGVDSDQAAIVAQTDPEQANFILTSMTKNIGASLLRALELHLAGEAPYGELEALGIAEGGVGLAQNDIYAEQTPDDIAAMMETLTQAVIDGEIEIVSAFGENAVAPGAGCAAMPATEFDAMGD